VTHVAVCLVVFVAIGAQSFQGNTCCPTPYFYIIYTGVDTILFFITRFPPSICIKLIVIIQCQIYYSIWSFLYKTNELTKVDVSNLYIIRC